MEQTSIGNEGRSQEFDRGLETKCRAQMNAKSLVKKVSSLLAHKSTHTARKTLRVSLTTHQINHMSWPSLHV